MEKQLSVTKSRPVPKPRKSLVSSSSVEQQSGQNENDDVFVTGADEKEVRQNEENEKKLKSMRSKSYAVAVREESLDVVIPNSMEMCSEGDGYLPMGKTIVGQLDNNGNDPAPLRRPPKSHSAYNIKNEETYIIPVVRCSVAKSHTSDNLASSSQKVVPTRSAPPPPQLSQASGVYSFDDHVKVRKNSSDITLKERPHSTVWFGEKSSDELDSAIPMHTDISALSKSDVKLPSKKEKPSYRPSLIGSHILGTIKSWTSPTKSEKQKTSTKCNRASMFYYEAPEENTEDDSEKVEEEEEEIPPPIPPPRQDLSFQLLPDMLDNIPPVPAPRPPGLSVSSTEGTTNDHPPLPPPRSKRKLKSTNSSVTDSIKAPLKKSLHAVGECHNDLALVKKVDVDDGKSLTVQSVDGEQSVSSSNTVTVNQILSADYIDLSQQILDDVSIQQGSPNQASFSAFTPSYANLTSDEQSLNDLDVQIPPSGGLLPDGADGPLSDNYQPNQTDLDQTEPTSQTNLEYFATDMDLDIVVYEDNDSESSDSEYFEGYVDPEELADQSFEKVPVSKKKSVKKNNLTVPDTYAPALPPRTRSPSPSKLHNPTQLSSLNSQSSDKSKSDYMNFLESHPNMVKRYSGRAESESENSTSSNCDVTVIKIKQNCDNLDRNNSKSVSQDSTVSVDSCDILSEIIKDTTEKLPALTIAPGDSEMSGAARLTDDMLGGRAKCNSLSSISSSDSAEDVLTPCGLEIPNNMFAGIARTRKGGSTLKPNKQVQDTLSSSDSSSDDSDGGETTSVRSKLVSNTSTEAPHLILGTPPRVILRRKPAVSVESNEGDSRPTSWASMSSAGSDLPHMAHMYLGDQQGGNGSLGDVSIRSSMSSLDQSGEEEDGVDSVKLQMVKKRKKQFYVAQEMMTSERSFVDILTLLNVEAWVKRIADLLKFAFREAIVRIWGSTAEPLLSKQGGVEICLENRRSACQDYRRVIARSSEAIHTPVVPPTVLSQLLRHLPELQKFNETLLHDLMERIQNWEKTPKVADIFVKMGAFLKLYTAYIMDFESKCALLDDARKKYLEFDRCTTIFEASGRCHGLSLKHYMLKPVQRLPQYRLLLRDYQKCLSKDSPDYKDTETALAIVTEVAEHANKSMKYGDNINKLLEIQNSLVGNFEVIRPGRYLVKEGELMKLSRKVMQPRKFYLLNDILLYTTPYSAPYAVSNYRLNNAIPLTGMKVKVPDKEDFQNEFSIISKQRSFTICAKTPEEKDSWLQVLRQTIAENEEKRKSFIPTDALLSSPETATVLTNPWKKSEFRLGSQHPVWIPDTRVSMCMLCTGEFTLAFRRHHCRSCGKVVCGFCSDFKAPLEYLDFKAGRVCKDCYGKLKRETRSSLSCTDREQVEQAKNLLGKYSKSSYGIRSKLLKITDTQMHRVSKIRETLGMGSWTKPQALKEVSATGQGAQFSGYLRLWKDKKWCKIWFVVKGKVLYRFKGSEDTAATDSTVLLGYECRPFLSFFQGVAPQLLFELIHKGLPNLLFATENPEARSKWMNCIREASIP